MSEINCCICSYPKKTFVKTPSSKEFCGSCIYQRKLEEEMYQKLYEQLKYELEMDFKEKKEYLIRKKIRSQVRKEWDAKYSYMIESLLQLQKIYKNDLECLDNEVSYKDNLTLFKNGEYQPPQKKD